MRSVSSNYAMDASCTICVRPDYLVKLTLAKNPPCSRLRVGLRTGWAVARSTGHGLGRAEHAEHQHRHRRSDQHRVVGPFIRIAMSTRRAKKASSKSLGIGQGNRKLPRGAVAQPLTMRNAAALRSRPGVMQVVPSYSSSVPSVVDTMTRSWYSATLREASHSSSKPSYKVATSPSRTWKPVPKWRCWIAWRERGCSHLANRCMASR